MITGTSHFYISSPQAINFWAKYCPLFFFPAGNFLLKSNPKSGGLPAGFEQKLFVTGCFIKNSFWRRKQSPYNHYSPSVNFFDYYSFSLSCASGIHNIPQNFPCGALSKKKQTNMMIYIIQMQLPLRGLGLCPGKLIYINAYKYNTPKHFLRCGTC